MAKSVFYSVSLRSRRPPGAVGAQPQRARRAARSQQSEWETVRLARQTAIKNWINKQMAYKKAVIILIAARPPGGPGSSTRSRRGVGRQEASPRRPHPRALLTRTVDSAGPQPVRQG
jgi:hypothetical protein